MPLENKTGQLIEEIKLFIQYSVPENDLLSATELIDRYKKNAFVIRLFREYYSNLPEAREEAIVKIVRLIDHQGVHLFIVWTASFAYLYAVSVDHVLFLGEYQQEVDTEVLSFFGLESQEEFLQVCLSAKELEESTATGTAAAAFCPVCGVPEGENHLLGCTVEICPWCEGQLSYCNCRFEQLNTDAIEDEQQLERLLDMLTAKGRIPYKKSQDPAFPGTSGGLDDSQATG